MTITKEQVVQLAREAGLINSFGGNSDESLINFARLVGNAKLEEAKQVAAAYGPSRPIVVNIPSLSVRGRWEGEQAASIGIALAIESLKDNTP